MLFRTNIFLLAVIFLSVPTLLFPHSSEIIYKTDPEYMLAEFAAVENGRALLSNQHAVTRREFTTNVLMQKNQNEKGVLFDNAFVLRPFLAGYYSPYYDYRSYPLPLMYLFEDQMDIFSFQLAMSVDDFLYFKTDYAIGASSKEFSGPGAYHPASLSYFAAGDSPDEGYISFSRDHLSMTLGRFKGGIGHGIQGNLFQNSRAPYYDQFQFSAFTDWVKVYFMIGTSNYYLDSDELQVQNNAPESEEYDKSWGSSFEDYHAQKQTSDNIKMFSFHRIEFKPFETLHLGFGEMNLIGGKVPDINMVNPFAFYHDSYDAAYHSYTFLFDISYNPLKRHLVFFEFLSNEIRVPGEKNTDPTAVGFMGGYWYMLPLETTTKHRIGIEAAHLDTWTYSDRLPYLTMYQRQVRRVATYDVPLGYSYGGDCEHFSLSYTAVNSAGLLVELSLQRLHKGGVNFDIREDGTMPYDDASKYQGRPSGTVERWSTLTGSATIPLNDNTNILCNSQYSYIENLQNEKGRNKHLVYLASGVEFIF